MKKDPVDIALAWQPTRPYVCYDKTGAEVGVQRAQTEDEAIGKAQIRYGVSGHPYTVKTTWKETKCAACGARLFVNPREGQRSDHEPVCSDACAVKLATEGL